MSLPRQTLYSVPAQTQRVARAAFPKGSLCLRLADELGTLCENQDFADLFPPQGQPALAPFRLALITVLQWPMPCGAGLTGNICCVWNWTIPALTSPRYVSFAPGWSSKEPSAGCLRVCSCGCGNVNW